VDLIREPIWRETPEFLLPNLLPNPGTAGDLRHPESQGFSLSWRFIGSRHVSSFDGGILKSADELLEAKRFSYQRGAATLLELLDAQRSANDIRADYEQALSDAARAEIDFERASGAEMEIHF